MSSKVYFTKDLSPEKVVELYKALGVELPGKVAVKLHSGEQGNQNFLRPSFWKPMIEKVDGTVVECNTAYGDAFGGVRDHTESHLKLIKDHENDCCDKPQRPDCKLSEVKVAEYKSQHSCRDFAGAF